MEIERKFLIDPEKLPLNPESYPCFLIEQGYLCINPVVRIRRSNEDYYLTYKSGGLLAREEYNLPLTQASYLHLRDKVDGILLAKRRYVIPIGDGLNIELDAFEAPYEGLWLAEIEFSSKEDALAYQVPDWFGKEVTFSGEYQNSVLSQGLDPRKTVSRKPS